MPVPPNGLDAMRSSVTDYSHNDQIRHSTMDAQEQHRPRKRRRAALSCEQCRQRKLKCDRGDPCGACVKSNLPGCVYKSNHGLGDLPNNETRSLGHTPPGSTTAVSSRLPPTPAFTQSPTGRPSDPQQIFPLPNKDLSRPVALDESLRHMNPEPLKGIRGTYSKQQLFGESHWTSYLTTSSIAIEGIREIAREGFSDAFGLLGKCKVLAREVKAQEAPDKEKLRHGESLFPGRALADKLVEAYLQTLETVFRILDVEQFKSMYARYWEDPESVLPSFHWSLLLIFANGVAVSSDHGVTRQTVMHWIYYVSERLNHPRAKIRLDLWSIRSHCLLMIARQSNGVDNKTSALSAASLVVTAMHMGLHVDPSHFAESQIPKEEREIRRRLWAAVLELELQAAMDSGGRPLIRDDDYDCAPPSNVEERELNALSIDAIISPGEPQPSTPDRPKILPAEQHTRSSLQILLARSLPVRLRIVRFVNDYHPGLKYNEALAMSKELVEEMRRSNNLIEGWRKSGAPITSFQIEVFNVLMYRFLMALHYSFALKAKDEPLFYYSRKICLDSSLALLTPPVSQRDPVFYRLALRGRSAFQDVYTGAANFISEYIAAERSSSAFPLLSISASPNDGLIEAIEGHLPLSLARIESGETNVKSHLLFRCLLAYTRSVRSGTDIRDALRTAINTSLEDAYTALRTRLDGPSPATDTRDNGQWGEELSLENLFEWLQQDEVFATNEGGTWMNGLDWSGDNTSAMAVGAQGL